MAIDSKSVKKKGYLTIGVTGGIGSGKSTVCGIFSSFGRTIVSADSIAREITETDREIRKRIQNAFGKGIYQSDGSLDRKRLAEIVFSKKESLTMLNGIVHPAVSIEIDKRLAGFSVSQRVPFVLVEAALIFESGMEDWLDYVLVVHADERIRVTRVMERDTVAEHEVLLRMKSQLSEEKKMKEADFILVNNDTPEKLLQGVKFYDGLFTTLAGQQA